MLVMVELTLARDGPQDLLSRACEAADKAGDYDRDFLAAGSIAPEFGCCRFSLSGAGVWMLNDSRQAPMMQALPVAIV